MKLPFTRTTRWMSDDHSPLPWPVLVLLVLMMGGWVGWFMLGRVKVQAVTTRARLEVDSLAHTVQPPVDGVVEENLLALGRQVVKGDVLLRLECKAEQLQLEQERVRLKGYRLELDVRQRELGAEGEALAAQRQVVGTATQVAQARGRVAQMMSEQASREDQMMQQLRGSALATGLEAARSASEARRQQAEALAATLEASRIASTGQTALKDRSVQLVRLEHDIAVLQTAVDLSTATIARLEFDIERRTLRAAVSGTVADLAPSPEGTTLEAGQKVAVIVPAGGSRIVARFTPAEAVGRVRPGQEALLRLDAFPWTEYGVLAGRVEQVAYEPQEGLIRTELTLVRRNEAIPLGHGMTGSVEVEIEEVAPFRLLLRAAGQLAAPAVTTPPVSSSPPSAQLP